MIVAKFGGTSLRDAEGFLGRVPIVRERAESGCLVVASAMAEVSRDLLRMSWLAETGARRDAEELRIALLQRHAEVLEQAGVEGQSRLAASEAIDAQGDLLRQALDETTADGVLARSVRDRVLAVGELLSSRLLAAVLTSHGVPATWRDPRELVVSDEAFGNARYDTEATQAAVRRTLAPDVGPGRVTVTGGFVGRSRGGATTTLGWGASDTSATLLGACLGAREVEIWTDVDGIATADPRLVDNARSIDRLSFDEASELTFFGAQVLHFSSIRPAREAGTAIRVRSSFLPDRSGTLIDGRRAAPAAAGRVRGVAMAGPVSRRIERALTVCGRDHEGVDPPWALVKGRTLPGEVTILPGESLCVLALVGSAVGTDETFDRATRSVTGTPPVRLRSHCPTHLAVTLPAEEAEGALRALHREFCAED